MKEEAMTRFKEEAMKRSILLVVVLAFTCLLLVAARSQNAQSGVSRDKTLSQDKVLSQDTKVKIKNSKVMEKDKSKPVRRALEDWYARNMDAFNAKDVTAIMALRTDDFHTITPDGKVNTRADMEARTISLVGRIDHFISQDFQIGTIEVEGDLASADITQKTVRMQRFPDGTLHKVEAGAVQRETWRKTAEGWKLYLVDNIRDTGVLVDDKPLKQ
jgi:ketosteroid isomerase-like protein/predicted small secreted protein